MRNYSFLLIWLLASSVVPVFAARVETVFVHSDSMNKDIETVVIVPDGAGGKLPVVYLLHGYGCGDHPAQAWILIHPELKDAADRYNVIIACPDGKEFWYLDSPADPAIRYDTFVSSELVAYIDTHYTTNAERGSRAISGFSMGGFGALSIALRHGDIFGAAGSTSGIFDISVKRFPKNSFDTSPGKDFNLTAVLGPYDKKLRKDYSPANKMELLKNAKLALIIDCGYDDTLVLKDNIRFHKKLLKNKIPHDFTLRPGEHTIAYWGASIDYHILFFARYFFLTKSRMGSARGA
jgi:S-formylglutathione hydrolase FrmB